LQKRQITAPGCVTGLAKDRFNASSSISTISSPMLGRGLITGVAAIFSETVGDTLRGGGAA
jgi:hypothetical protein